MAKVVPLPTPEASPEDRPVLVVDLGGQYSQLIARRVREARVYSELVSHRLTAAEIGARNPLALILSGGPASVYVEGAPGGGAVTESRWLIHTTCSAGRSRKSGDSPRIASALPYSETSFDSTEPPRSRAITCIP